MKALIAAGGKGTRLRPITYSMNKHMIPLANIPMIEYAIKNVASAGITEIAININEGDKEFPEAVGDGSKWNVNITYLEQKGGALGLAHIIKNAQEWLGDDNFIFYLGDNIVVGSLAQFVSNFESTGASGYLALSEVPDPTRFGVPELDDSGNIIRVLEKPDNPPSQYAVTGIYCYTKEVHEAVNAVEPSARGELEISDVHTYMIEKGMPVKYEVVEGWWKDTGTPGDLLAGNNIILQGITPRNNASVIDGTVQINGLVSIGEDVALSGNTIINGPVIIGPGATIKDAVIGPHVSVGSNVTIHQATIQNSIVMDDVVVESDRFFVDSIIGHNARILPMSREAGVGTHLIVGENSQVEL